MFSVILILALLLLSMIVIMFIHPLTLAFLLMVVAIFTSILSCFMSISWIFYTLILVFLGGVIVVVLFIVSLCRNEQFFYNKFRWIKRFTFYLAVLLPLNIFLKDLERFSSYKVIVEIYEVDVRCVYLFLAITLLLCLFTAVYLRKVEMGPLVSRL